MPDREIGAAVTRRHGGNMLIGEVIPLAYPGDRIKVIVHSNPIATTVLLAVASERMDGITEMLGPAEARTLARALMTAADRAEDDAT